MHGVRLTQYSNGGGCACKLPQSMLSGVLAAVRHQGGAMDPALLVGLEDPDDAAVYRIADDRALVVSCDFMTPVVDDPRSWGTIAAVHAFSDVYAMGGHPLLALNLLCWPAALPQELMRQLLEGAAEATVRAGAVVVGGHSVVDPTPKFGLVAIGQVDPRRLITKGGGRPGDVLVLTKPLGTGIVGTALKNGRAPAAVVEAATVCMARPNAAAAGVARQAGVRGGTDVTGFGLLGHVHEMAAASGLAAELWTAGLPVLPGVRDLVAAGFLPDGSRRNLRHALDDGWFLPDGAHEQEQGILADAQTSGGLLLAVPPHEAQGLVEKILGLGDEACIVGRLTRGGPPGRVQVRRDGPSPNSDA